MAENPFDPNQAHRPPPPPPMGRQPVPVVPVPVVPIDTLVGEAAIDAEVEGAESGEIPLAEPAPAPAPAPLPPPMATPYPGGGAYGQAYPPQHGYAPPPYAQPQGYAYQNPPYASQWSGPAVYAHPTAGRPGIVTALGVMSIVVASLSLIGSIFSGCTAITTRNMAEQTAKTATPVAGPFATTMPGMPGGGTAPAQSNANAMDAPDRQVVIRALSSKRRLSEKRRQQLDAFLSEHGKLILDNSAGPLSLPRVHEHLGEVGSEYAGPNSAGPDFFVIKEGNFCDNPGRLVVYDDRVLFRPDDGSPPLRSSADKPGEGSAGTGKVRPTTAPAAQVLPVPPGIPGQGLSPNQSNAVVGRVNALANNLLNPQQLKTLKDQLESSSYAAYVQYSSTNPGLTSQVKSAVVHDDGSVTVTFTMGTMTIDVNGQVTNAATTFTGQSPAVASPNNPWAAMNLGSMEVSRTATTLAAAEAALSLLLAIFLLVVGILVLRQSPHGRKFYLFYALLKLGSGILAIVVLSRMVGSIVVTDPGSFGWVTTMARTYKGMGTAAIVITCIGLLFPIAILILLAGSRELKDYYKAA